MDTNTVKVVHIKIKKKAAKPIPKQRPGLIRIFFFMFVLLEMMIEFMLFLNYTDVMPEFFNDLENMLIKKGYFFAGLKNLDKWSKKTFVLKFFLLLQFVFGFIFIFGIPQYQKYLFPPWFAIKIATISMLSAYFAFIYPASSDKTAAWMFFFDLLWVFWDFALKYYFSAKFVKKRVFKRKVFIAKQKKNKTGNNNADRPSTPFVVVENIFEQHEGSTSKDEPIQTNLHSFEII